MTGSDALVCAYTLDGAGGATELSWEEITNGDPLGDQVWVHLDRRDPGTRLWLDAHSRLDPVIIDALLEEETRPRCESFDDGIFIILRGVNLNPGAEPEDMISIRIWIDGQKIITTRGLRLMAVQDVRGRLAGGQAPKTVSALLTALAGNLIDRMAPVIDGLEEKVDTIEEEVVLRGSQAIRTKLVELRQQTIALRRYIAPQRDALTKLLSEERTWLLRDQLIRLREISDRTMRYIDDLDNVRERAGIVQDELMNRLSEQMNRAMYVLTLVAAIMLPLGFITGLLGINVGGIPGSENPSGFFIVCLILLGLVGVQIIVFRRLNWF